MTNTPASGKPLSDKDWEQRLLDHTKRLAADEKYRQEIAKKQS